MIKELLNKPGNVKYFAQLDFKKNKELQDIVSLAAELCQTPVALLTFMDEEEQLIKVRIGTEVERNTREHSFCKHLTSPDKLLIVPNASLDARFVNNPLVVGASHIRFYAGAPLCTDQGELLGSLCVLNNQPQELTERQQQMLLILSKQAYRLMELEVNNLLFKERTAELEQQKLELSTTSNKLRAIFESTPDCFMLLDKNLNIMAYNKSLAASIKQNMNKEIKTGMDARALISPSLASIYERNCNRALLRGKTTVKEMKVTYTGVAYLWWLVGFNPAYDCEGNIIGVTVNAKDITQRKAYEEQVMHQNVSLKKIAFIQSHEVRKPLANILGLVALLKQRGFNDEIHDHLETSAKELDQRLCNAAKHAENYDPKKIELIIRKRKASGF